MVGRISGRHFDDLGPDFRKQIEAGGEVNDHPWPRKRNIGIGWLRDEGPLIRCDGFGVDDSVV